MTLVKTILGYLKWHYGKALFSVFNLWENILVFLFHFFSLKSLISNFFMPWRRLTENYPRFGVDSDTIQRFLIVFIINSTMRILGMFLRTFAILAGICVCLFFILTLPLSIIFWIILPFLILWLIISGLTLIFTF